VEGAGEGSGLGLAICQSICERAGAELRLDRAHAPGARFVLTVPRAYG
jgi:signal transduction histidine kinase